MIVWIVCHSYREDINGGEYDTWHDDEFVDVFASKEAAEAAYPPHVYSDDDYYSIREVVVSA